MKPASRWITSTADIVWMGYGIDAPEFNWNDYKDVDVKGKVLLMLVNEPPSEGPNFFAGKALTYYGRWTYKFEEAARKGAAGVILIHKTEMASYGWNVVRNSLVGRALILLRRSSAQAGAGFVDPVRRGAEAGAGCGMNLDEMIAAAQASRGFKAVVLPARAEGPIVSQVRDFDSNNVIAKLPGASQTEDAGRALHRALRSPGHRPGMPGDNIYNGAQDNATGCGILLEIARAYAQRASAAQALHLLRRGHGGGARAARVRISGQTSARPGEPDRARPELRQCAYSGSAGRSQRLRR